MWIINYIGVQSDLERAYALEFSVKNMFTRVEICFANESTQKDSNLLCEELSNAGSNELTLPLKYVLVG